MDLKLCSQTKLLPPMIKAALNYQMWDALMKVECSLEEFSSSWRQSLKKDLKKRISKVSDCSSV